MWKEKWKKRVAPALVTALCTGLLVSGVVLANPEGTPDPEEVAIVNVDKKDSVDQAKADKSATEKKTDADDPKEEKKETTSKDEKEKAKETDSKKEKTDAGKSVQTAKKTDDKKKQSSSGNGSSGTSSGGAAGNSTPAPTPSQPSGGSGSQAQPSKPAHVHSYSIPITETINHPAEYTQVYHPEVGHEVQRCKTCGAINPDSAHAEAHALAGENSGTYSDWIVDQAAWTENVLVKNAWTETRTIGYKCSCGAVQ